MTNTLFFNVVLLVLPVVVLCRTNHMDSQGRLGWEGWLVRFEGTPGIYYSSFPDDTDRKPNLGITALP